jgi:hypothetical protein
MSKKEAKKKETKTQDKNQDNVVQNNLESLPKEIQDKMEKMKEKIDSFNKKIIEKFDKYIMGVALLPPKKDDNGKIDKDAVNLLVLIDDSDSEKMSKQELKEKLSTIISNMGKETDKNFNCETIILSELWQSCYDQKPELVQLIANRLHLFMIKAFYLQLK